MSKSLHKFDSSSPAVSINAYGVTFNTALVELLKSPEFVAVGVNIQEKKLAIKPLQSDSKAFRCYPFVKNGKKYIAVRSTKLIDEIAKLKLDLDEDKIYPAVNVPLKGMVMISLTDQ